MELNIVNVSYSGTVILFLVRGDAWPEAWKNERWE